MLIREEADFKIDDKRAFTLIDTKLFQKKKKKKKKKERKEKKRKEKQGSPIWSRKEAWACLSVTIFVLMSP